MSHQLVLRVVSGPFEDLKHCEMSQLFHWLQMGQSLTVGRGGFHVDWSVRQDDLMSRQHFRVSCGQECYLRDLDTANGTYVNGQQVREATLRDGDIIRAGKTVFAVALDQAETEGVVTDADPQPQVAENASQSESTDTREFSRVVFKIDSGPFAELENANMTQLLNWVDAGQSVIIGRSPQSDFTIRQDRRMSSRHFELSYDGQTCRVRDLNSRNGTYVNGRRVEDAVLQNGDRVTAGRSVFSILVLGVPEPVGDGPTKAAESDEATLAPGAEELTIASAPPPMQAVVTIVGGPDGDLQNLRVSRLVAWLGAGQTMTIGRSKIKADFVVGPDSAMSDSHFRLSCDGEFCRLRDLGSQMGTRVNGELVEKIVLQDGDDIIAGRTRFRVAIQGGRSADDAPSSEEESSSMDEESWSDATCLQHGEGASRTGDDIRSRLKQTPRPPMSQ